MSNEGYSIKMLFSSNQGKASSCLYYYYRVELLVFFVFMQFSLAGGVSAILYSASLL